MARIKYRLFEQDDLSGLIRLWEQEAGWGKLTPEMWRQWYVDGPLGRSAIVVAADKQDGSIVGGFAFMPVPLLVNGRRVQAFRPAAPILAKSIRGVLRNPNPFHHPIAAMYLHAVNALRDGGHGLIYMVPDPRWMRLFRMFPGLRFGSFPLWSLPLPLTEPLPLGDGFTAERLKTFDERVDRLWTLASRFYGCSIIRNSGTLCYKIGGENYRVLGIIRDGEMVGLVAGCRKGDRQWLICDVLAADMGDSLRATLAAAVNAGHDEAVGAAPDRPIRKAGVLVTPLMESVVRSLGFGRDNYDFPLILHILDATLKEEVDPARWYVSAND